MPKIEQQIAGFEEKFLHRIDIKKFEYNITNIEKDNSQMNLLLKTKFDDFKNLAKEVEMLNVEMMKYVDVKQIDLLKGRIDGVDANLHGIRKTTTDMEKKVKQIRIQNQGANNEPAAIERIVSQIELLRNNFEEYQETSNAKISYFEDEFPLKAYKSDV